MSAAIIAAPLPAAAQVQVSPVSSIDPAHTDYSDLQPLAEAIGEKRIVMLGEASHGDGATFLAKTRIIQFLHQQLGFDVLVFESGISDLHIAQQAIDAGADIDTAIKKSVFPLWSRSDQLRPLVGYLEQQRAGGAPITLAGFDMQMSGDGPAAIIARMDEMAGKAGADRAPFDRMVTTFSLLRQFKGKGFGMIDLDQIARDAASIDKALANSPDPDARYWNQVTQSLAAFLPFVSGMMAGPSPATFDLREKQMAGNFHWLASEGFADRKLMVWGATSHLIADRTAIDVEIDETMVPMGAQIRELMDGNEVYTLAFTAGGGANGSIRSTETFPLEEPPEDSIEGELMALGGDYYFQRLDASDGKRVARLLGHADWAGEWHRAADGMIFIREMTPTTFPQKE
ncbi:erythromycin esterase family protein [Altererythrobacter sp. ZODW24]|uniref:erythromycin esterase family protein n=1 Tax=Altererythrobacter sp. ZODW24 TaxID=2185142 RepID=UPI0013B3EF69|nr:erythromycin esterase family protein [Altererythrobacter sp. ZODW24]